MVSCYGHPFFLTQFCKAQFHETCRDFLAKTFIIGKNIIGICEKLPYFIVLKHCIPLFYQVIIYVLKNVYKMITFIIIIKLYKT